MAIPGPSHVMADAFPRRIRSAAAESTRFAQKTMSRPCMDICSSPRIAVTDVRERRHRCQGERHQCSECQTGMDTRRLQARIPPDASPTIRSTALEALLLQRVRGDRGRQDLDGDLTFQPGIGRPKHLSHTALANRRGDFVRAEAGTWCKGHVCVSGDYRVARPVRSHAQREPAIIATDSCL